jgi:uncharacterized integral membrane protein
MDKILILILQVITWQWLGVPVGIRIPGSKSQAERSQLSVPTEKVSADVALPGEDDNSDAVSESGQSNAERQVADQFAITEIESTRASRAWTRILPALLLLAIILVFVFQNLDNTKITFLMFSGTVPAALALIIASALGGLLVLTIGSIRIIQLRKVIHTKPESRTIQSNLHWPKHNDWQRPAECPSEFSGKWGGLTFSATRSSVIQREMLSQDNGSRGERQIQLRFLNAFKRNQITSGPSVVWIQNSLRQSTFDGEISPLYRFSMYPFRKVVI